MGVSNCEFNHQTGTHTNAKLGTSDGGKNNRIMNGVNHNWRNYYDDNEENIKIHSTTL